MIYNTIWYKNSFRPLQDIDYYYYAFLHSNTELIKLFLSFSLILEFMKIFLRFPSILEFVKIFSPLPYILQPL